MRLWICERCRIIVPPDRDGCPNIEPHLHGLDPANHPTVAYAPEETIEARIALSAVAAAEASLEIVKAALR